MELITATIATYALTLVLTSSDGPWGIFARLRAVKGLGALKCFLCTSVWAGAILAIYPATSLLGWPLYTLALAGGAVLLDRLTMGRL